jgi:hypothetical protein
MSQHQTISSGETPNRSRSANSLRPTRIALIVALPNGQLSLLTADTHFVVYMSAKIRSLRRSGCLRSACSTSTWLEGRALS